MRPWLIITLLLTTCSCAGKKPAVFHPPSMISADTAYANRSLAAGYALYRGAKYDSSIVLYKSALPVYQRYSINDKVVLCLDYLNIAYRSVAQFDRALAYCDSALAFARTVFGEKSGETADAYSSTGVVYQVMGDFNRSLQFHTKALAIREELFGPESHGVGVSVSNLAIVYYLKGEYDKSIASHLRAIAIREKILGAHSQALASNWLNLGVVYRVKADYEKTLECYSKALAILKAEVGENHPRVARVYGNMAIVYDLQGDYHLSLEYHQRALQIREATLGPDHPDVGYTLNDLGILEYNLGKYSEALAYLQRAGRIFATRLSNESALIAQSHKNIGNAFRKLQKFDEADENFRLALEKSRALFTGPHPEVAMDYFSIGENFYDRKNHERADAYFDSSLVLLKACFGDRHPLIATCLMAKARSLKNLGRPDDALALTHRSIQSLGVDEKNGTGALSNVDYLDALALLADLYAIRNRAGDRDSAAIIYEKASGLIDKMRRGYRVEGSKLVLASRVKSVMESALRLEIENYKRTGGRAHLENAFQWSEKSKAAVLLDAMTESRATRFGGLGDSLVELESSYKRDLTFYETQIQQEMERTVRDSARLLEYEAGRFAVRQAYEEFIHSLEQTHPKYFDLKYRSPTPALDDIQKALDSKTLWVEYFIGDSAGVCFVVSRSKAGVFQLKTDTSLARTVQDVRRALLELDFKSYITSANLLSNVLLRPWLSGYSNYTRIVVVPDGALHYLPFDALFTENVVPSSNPDFTQLPYLAKKSAISVMYSAEFLNEDGETGSSDGLIVAPVFERSKWEPLPYSVQEAGLVDSLFQKNGGHDDRLVGTDATEGRFKSTHLDHYGFIHIASHGIINQNFPKLSGIVFQHDSLSAEDGVLYAAEVYNLKLRANLVTLSACETGSGTVARGEGLMGLTRGFLYAGARRMLVSLWRVDDKLTAASMANFYKEALRTADYQDALHKMKLGMIKDRKTAYPGNWSAFVLIGK